MKTLSLSALLLSGFLLAPRVLAADTPKTPVEPAAKAADAKDTKKVDVKAKAPAAEVKDTKDVKTAAAGPVVEMKTTHGTVKIELDEKAAPETVKNFLAYVNDKFYDGTVFHRVIDGFMIQGGGYTLDGGKLTEKSTKAPIKNEAKNGLKNDRGTIAMARTGNPDSATSQFFINHVNNDRLNYPQPDGHGYAVFGRVTDGLDVVEKIAKVKTGMRDGMQDVPTEEVKILSVTLLKPNS